MHRVGIHEVHPILVQALIEQLTRLYFDLGVLINGEKTNVVALMRVNYARNRIKGLIMDFYNVQSEEGLSNKQKEALRTEIQRMHTISIYLVGLPFVAHSHRQHELYSNAVTAKKRVENLMEYLGQDVKALREMEKQLDLSDNVGNYVVRQ